MDINDICDFVSLMMLDVLQVLVASQENLSCSMSSFQRIQHDPTIRLTDSDVFLQRARS